MVVVDYISQVVSSAVVRLTYAHRVMCEVHIAVIAWFEGQYRSSELEAAGYSRWDWGFAPGELTEDYCLILAGGFSMIAGSRLTFRHLE